MFHQKRGTNKYRSVKVITEDGIFASKKEFARFNILKLLERAGKILNLRCQVPYIIMVNGIKICKYIADFVYFDLEKQSEIIEDVKSPASKTSTYLLKKKLMKAVFGIDIFET